MFQLCSRNEYGETSILASSNDPLALVKRAKEEVCKINVDNALTTAEKDKNWEAYFVEVLDEDGNASTGVYYSAKDSTGKHSFYESMSEQTIRMISDSETLPDTSLRIYLGTKENPSRNQNNWYQDWYAVDDRLRPIVNLNNPSLAQKTVFFLKKVGK